VSASPPPTAAPDLAYFIFHASSASVNTGDSNDRNGGLRGGANVTMASTNDDGWRPYIVLSREDLTLSRFFHDDWHILLERPPIPMWACPSGWSVITREFGPGSVHGKRHSESGHYGSRRRKEIHRSRTRSGIFPIALHALIIATIVLNLNISPSWSGEYRRVRVRTCHD
jgi:hypothetical protein